jgi:hypothetical protein
MKISLKSSLLGAAVALGINAGAAQADVRTLDFDALTANALVPSGYGAFDEGDIHFAGFEWTSIRVAQQGDPTLNPFAVGMDHGVISPSNVMFNSGGAGSATIAALSQPFFFRGAQFTAMFDLSDFGMPGGTQSLTLQGWNGATLVFEESGDLNAFSPIHLAGVTKTIDHLVINTGVTFNGEAKRPMQWVADDFQYSVVPEPTAAVQLLAGAIMLSVFAFRARARR